MTRSIHTNLFLFTTVETSYLTLILTDISITFLSLVCFTVLLVE